MSKMVRMSMAVMMCLLMTFAAHALESGKVIEHLKMPSGITGGEVCYSVYLPPDYDISKRDYPVFYLLHGAGDDDAGWVQLGEIRQIMDMAIASGEVTPMIVAMPDGRRDVSNRQNTFYVNDADGGLRWGDMFVQEFIPYFEKTYRVRPERNVRAIGGLSMGGYGALYFSLKYPDMFAATVALSAAVLTEEQTENLPEHFYYPWFSKSIGEGLEGKERINDNFRKANPIHMLETASTDDLKKLNLFFDCGSEDELDFDVGNFVMHLELRKRGIPHSFTLRAGTHSWAFWRTGILQGMIYTTDIVRN